MNLIDYDSKIYLTADSFIEINNIITGSSNITLRQVYVNPHGFDKMYMDKDLLEDKPYQIRDRFNEKKITPTKFYSILLNEIRTFYDGNGRRCQILFANGDKINL